MPKRTILFFLIWAPSLQSGAAASLYQMERSYLQRSSDNGIVTSDFGEEFNYNWDEVKK